MKSLIKYINESFNIFDAIHYGVRVLGNTKDIKEAIGKKYSNVEEAIVIYNKYLPLQSCGKCPPCYIGTKRILETMQFELNGEEVEEIIIEDLMEMVQTIRDKKCPTKFYEREVIINITDKCIGCTKCAKACPVHCISGKLKSLHNIEQSSCIKCGKCVEVCPVKAITANIGGTYE